MKENVTYKFGNIQERDMDLLFLESIATDESFVRLLLEKIEKSKKPIDRTFKLEKENLSQKMFSVLSVELSATDPELWDSDITAVIKIDGIRLGLLLEDKIDAPAMPEQCNRYSMRAVKAMNADEYDEIFVFIICPKKYYCSPKSIIVQTTRHKIILSALLMKNTGIFFLKRQMASVKLITNN